MQIEDIRVFVPCKNYDISRRFYQALGFKVSDAGEELSIVESGQSTFFLQKYFNQAFCDNLMLQLIVKDIEAAEKAFAAVQGFDFRYDPIKNEPWGKVIYLWGPSGELWHVTQLHR